MLNKVQLIGNVGKDPEVRYTPNNTPVASFSIATTEKWKDQAGNKKEVTDWHNIVIWGKLAEVAKEYVRKGHRIYVEGKIKQRTWEDKNNVKQYRTEIQVESMIMLNAKREGDQTYHPDHSHSSPEPDFNQQPNITSTDDLPF